MAAKNPCNGMTRSWHIAASFSLVLATPCIAAPTVSQVSGIVSHKSTITITGSTFGTKATAAPHKWDDFETGSVGSTVTNGWFTYSNLSGHAPQYSSERQRAPGRLTKAAYQNYLDGNYNSTLALVDQSPGFRSLYFSGWFYREVGGAPSRNVKPFSMRGGPSDSWNAPSVRYDQYPDQGAGQMMTSERSDGTCNDPRGSDSNVSADWGVGDQLYTNGWHRMEVWINTDSGGSNGEYTIWHDGVESGSIKGRVFGHDCPFPAVFLFSYFSTDTGSPTSWMKSFWDEAYFDRTRARVEIGNASTWSASTHREIQIPSAWSNGSVTVTVNQGSFSAGEKAYLYVVDSNGNSSGGFPVTIGSGGGESASSPAAPSGLAATGSN